MKCEYKKGLARIHVPAREYRLETVKFAAYMLTGRYFVQLCAEAGGVLVIVEAKDAGARDKLRETVSVFKRELKDEDLRFRIEANDRGLRERIVRLAIQGEAQPAQEGDASLTDEQQKDLDRIIAEVEDELRKESAKPKADPLGVTKTWEEQHGPEKTKAQ